MRMQHMEALCFNLSVAKKTLLMLFPTLIAVNRSTHCRLCLYFRHICTDTHRQNEEKKRQLQRVCEVRRHLCIALPVLLYTVPRREAGALCIFVPLENKKNSTTSATFSACADHVRVCVCMSPVCLGAGVQPGACYGLCGCGWWLACLHCRQLRRNCLFFPVFLSACVCTCMCVLYLRINSVYSLTGLQIFLQRDDGDEGRSKRHSPHYCAPTQVL